MNARGWPILAAVWAISVAAAQGQGDPTKEQSLQGTWKAVEAVRGGVAARPEMLDNLRVVIQGDTLTIKEATGREEVAKFKLDPSKKPAQIDLTPTGKEGKPSLGIYKIEGGMLVLFWGKMGQERPKAFNPGQEARTSYLLLKKEK